MALDIEISKDQRGTCSVKLSGALDGETCAQFRSAIEPAKGTIFANRQEADIYLAMIQGSVPGGGTAAC